MEERIEKSDRLLTNKCNEQLDQNNQQLIQNDCNQTSNSDQIIDTMESNDGFYDQEWNRVSVNNVHKTSEEPVFAYQLKWINWKENKTPIITQNSNGPCPLLAIINVLILKGRIQLPSMMEIITDNQLMEYLGDCVLNSVPKVCTHF
jgi:hypothetical protein